MARTIRAILFDLGDTILDFGKVDLRALFEEGANLAYAYLQSFHRPLPPVGRYRRRHFHAIHWNEFKSRLFHREFNSLELMDRLCRRMGLRLTREQLVEICGCWYEPLRQTARVEDGVPERLREWENEGWKLGLVSNTFIPGPVLDRHLAQERLLDVLPVRVYSCDVGRRKPHPAVFREAARRLGVPAEETIFVGDLPKADVQGANRMGMVSVLKDPTGRFANHRIRPDHRIRRLEDLRPILAQYARATQ